MAIISSTNYYLLFGNSIWKYIFIDKRKHKIMKQFLLLFFAFNYAILYSQAPQAVTYQAVATDAAGLELITKPIGIRASVIQGQPNNPAVYIETHAVVTDTFGLFTINIGQGTYAGGTLTAFNQIDWGTGPYYLKIDMDANGGSNYSFIGTNQILSVPYALYSNKADTANYAFYSDTSNFAQYSDTSFYSINSLNDNDTDSTNELQTLSLNGDTLSISNGNSVIISGLGGGGSGNSPTPGSTISFNAINNNFSNVKYLPQFSGINRHPINGDSNGFIYITGQTTQGRVYLVKLDSVGNVIWDKTATNGFGEGIAIDLDNNDNIYITGTFRQTLTLDGQTINSNSNNDNMFVAKFNNSGNIQWIRFSVAGTGFTSFGNDLASDNNGNVYVTGTVDGGDGPIYAAANFSGTSILPFWKQIFVAKYDTNGSLLFVKTYISQLNQNNNSNSCAIEVDNNGIPYISGSFSCISCQFGNQTYAFGLGKNFFLSQLDLQGNVQWIKNVGGNASSSIFIDLAIDASNNIYVTGGNNNDTTAGFFTQGKGLFIAKYNSSGVPIFAKTVNGLAANIIPTESGINISFGSNNKVYVSGSYRSHFVGSNFTHFSNIQIGEATPFIIEFDATNGNLLDFNEVASLNIAAGFSYSTVSRGDNVYMLLNLTLQAGIPFVNNNIQYQQSGINLLRWK